ncbi:MAG: hypothetical protein ACRQFF_06825 [Sphaerochaeta sp.]
MLDRKNIFIISILSLITLLSGCYSSVDKPDVDSESTIQNYTNPTSYNYEGSWTSYDNDNMIITFSDDYLTMDVNRNDVPRVYIYSIDSTTMPDDSTLSGYFEDGAIVVDEASLDDYSAPDISVYYNSDSTNEDDDTYIVDIRYVNSYERYVFHFVFDENENTTDDDTITLTLEINDSNTASSPTEKTYTLIRDD